MMGKCTEERGLSPCLVCNGCKSRLAHLRRRESEREVVGMYHHFLREVRVLCVPFYSALYRLVRVCLCVCACV